VPTPSLFRENRSRGGKIAGVIAKRALGATGIEVGEIGLGAWQLGNTDQWAGPGRETSLRIVDEALRLGVNLFDTAPGYASGRSERLLGEAYRLSRRRLDAQPTARPARRPKSPPLQGI